MQNRKQNERLGGSRPARDAREAWVGMSEGQRFEFLRWVTGSAAPASDVPAFYAFGSPRSGAGG